MKHKIIITLLILGMFFATQLIGIAVISAYMPHVKAVTVGNVTTNMTIAKELPYGMEPPKTTPQNAMISIIISIVIVTILFLVFTKINADIVIKIWFFSVVAISIAITLSAFFSIFGLTVEKLWKLDLLAILIAVVIASFKIFRPNFFFHNISELLIYPGLAAVFVPILSPVTAIILLLIISVYDMYAVWKSKIMVKMAKYQMNTLRIFNGFFIPYIAKTPKPGEKVRIQMGKPMAKRISAKKMKKQKISVAILGGGDVAFPLIFAGVILRAISLPASLIIVGTATLSLFILLMYSQKGKAYPALPFLTAGCLVGYLIALLLL